MAVLVFAVCVHLARDSVHTYRQIALGALLISFLPNVAAGLLLKPAVDWLSMIALMAMHVSAWAVTLLDAQTTDASAPTTPTAPSH